MSQISPPLRIALVAAVVFLAAWMLVLRPKTEAVTPVADPVATATTTPAGNVATGKPAETAAGKLAEKAKSVAAGAATDAETAVDGSAAAPAATATPAAVTATAAATAAGLTPATTLSKTALAALPKPVAKALVARRVIVLGIVSGAAGAADDRLVAKELRHVNSYGGDVLVRTASVDDIAAYGPVVNSLQVNQTPSIAVIDRDRKATVLVGYQDGEAIDQAVVDARRASTPSLLTSGYLKALNRTCATYATLLVRSTSSAKDKRIATRRATALRGLKPTGRYRSLDKRVVKAAKGSTALSIAAAGSSLDAALDAAGVSACVAGHTS